MTYVVAAILLIAGLSFPKNKLLTFLILLYMWILMGLVTYTPDYASYEYIYALAPMLNLSLEPGYLLLIKLSSAIGMSYQQFRMVHAAICLTLTFRTIRYYTDNETFVLCCMLIFPFIANISALRSTLAVCIALTAVKYLFSTRRDSTLKYVAIIALSVTFHYMTVFFFILLLAKCKISRMGRIIMVFALMLLTGIAVTTNLIHEVASWFTSNAKLLGWLDVSSESKYEHTNLMGFLVTVGQFTFNYIVFYVGRKTLVLLPDGVPATQNTGKNYDFRKFIADRANLEILANFNLLIMFIIPLMTINGIFKRLFYSLVIINVCFTGYVLDKQQCSHSARSKKLRITFSATALLTILLCVVLMVLYTVYTPQNSPLNIMKYNLVFG